MTQCDYLVIGAGIIGLNIANQIKGIDEKARVIVLEKESEVGCHASGRNSGVLHAGFYYSPDSLKARFTRDGNRLMSKFCEENGLKINKCQKVVVASDETEVNELEGLYNRGVKNGVDVKLISEDELKKSFQGVRTYKKALLSPSTSTIDPVEVCQAFEKQLIENGVEISFSEGFVKNLGNNVVKTNKRLIKSVKIINCAGLYADHIAKKFGFSNNYTIIPFKGIYLKYSKPGSDLSLSTNVYPVPDLKNPFLGVHFTCTVDNEIKIGPTAIPAFWRENYQGLKKFRFMEMLIILYVQAKLIIYNKFNFRVLAIDELKKYYKPYFVDLASKLLLKLDRKAFNQWSKPGIRAQLLDVRTLELVQDFVVEGDDNSVHVLNAVSPAFTCSIPFSKWVVENYVVKKK